MAREANRSLRGVLHFYSETGTEGGYWAFQDSRFITKNTRYFSCTKCHKYWDKERNPDGPPAPESQTNEALVPVKTVQLTPEVVEAIQAGTYEEPPDCPSGEHDFQLTSDENWSYAGLTGSARERRSSYDFFERKPESDCLVGYDIS